MSIWKPPSMWKNGTCWIIGGGPSILNQFDVPKELQDKFKKRLIPLSELSNYLKALHDKHIIGINLAYTIGNWIDIVFFGDGQWFLHHRQALANFNGLKVSCSPRFKDWPDGNSERIKFMARNHERVEGITDIRGYVSWNRNSGAASISLAQQLGVDRIILLGFDMTTDAEQDTHWHGRHWEKRGGPFDPKGNLITLKKPTALPYERHLEGFPKIALDAERLNLEIINANPNSEIDAFPKYNVKDLL